MRGFCLAGCILLFVYGELGQSVSLRQLPVVRPVLTAVSGAKDGVARLAVVMGVALVIMSCGRGDDVVLRDEASVDYLEQMVVYQEGDYLNVGRVVEYDDGGRLYLRLKDGSQVAVRLSSVLGRQHQRHELDAQRVYIRTVSDKNFSIIYGEIDSVYTAEVQNETVPFAFGVSISAGMDDLGRVVSVVEPYSLLVRAYDVGGYEVWHSRFTAAEVYLVGQELEFIFGRVGVVYGKENLFYLTVDWHSGLGQQGQLLSLDSYTSFVRATSIEGVGVVYQEGDATAYLLSDRNGNIITMSVDMQDGLAELGQLANLTLLEGDIEWLYDNGYTRVYVTDKASFGGEKAVLVEPKTFMVRSDMVLTEDDLVVGQFLRSLR